MTLTERETYAAHPWVAEGTRRVRFGVSAGGLDAAAHCAYARRAEALGFDSYWLPDHPMLMPDSWTMLAAVAGATSTIRLGTLVTCAYYRNRVHLARIVADVDRISGGRTVLSIGSGDMPHEFAQMGLAYPPVRERQAALEEALRIVGPLQRGETVTLRGQHFQAEGAALSLPPVQRPHVPILIAGGGERTTLRLVAEYADASNLGGAAWAGGTATPADVDRKLAALRNRCDDVGRPQDSVLRTCLLVPLVLAASVAAAAAKLERVPARMRSFFAECAFASTADGAIAHLSALREAGFRYFIVSVGPQDDETLDLLRERVMPAVTGSPASSRPAAP